MKWTRVAGLLIASALAVAALQAAVVAQVPEGTGHLNESSRVFIQPSQISVEQGDIFSATVMIENAQDLVTYEFKMDWETSVLSVTGVTNAGFVTGVTPVGPNIDPSGTLRFAVRPSAPPPYAGVSGTGPLAVIRMQALDRGLIRLEPYDVEWYDKDDLDTPHEPPVQGGLVVIDGSFVYLPMVMRNYGP